MISSLISSIIFILFVHISYNQNFRINKLYRRNISYMDQTFRTLFITANTPSQINFGNQQNYLYYININVGTPAQNFNMIFDTGSNVAWLPLTGSGSTVTFNPSLSSTFNNTSTPGQISYADNSGVIGTMGSDILQIPAFATTNISVNQPFLWVTQEVNFNSLPIFIAGLLGMGVTNTPNFLDIAYQQNQIATPAFTLSIRSNTSTSSSYLYYNNIPQYIQNSTYYLPVVGSDYWSVQVVGVIVGGIQMSSVSANVAVTDSGTSFFYVNQNLYNTIMSNFFLDCVSIQGTPVCPCSQSSSWPQFTFLLDGIQVYIEPNQYVGIINSSQNQCTFNFGTLSTVSNQLLLGDIFFQAYDITFNKLTQEIGFSGNVGFLSKVTPLGANLTQYILLGIIILICLLGFIFIYLIDKNDNQSFTQQYQISALRKSSNFQPFVGRRVVLS